MDEIKHERFVRVVEKRMEVLINDFYKLGNCASRVSYDYSDAEVEQIIREIERQTDVLKERFAGKRAFALYPVIEEEKYENS